MPDGTVATDDDIAAAIYLALDHDEALCELLCVAKLGRRIDGTEVGWDARQEALDALDKLSAAPTERPVADRDIPNRILGAENLFAAADTGDRDARRTLATQHIGHGRALHPEPRRKVNARALLEEAAREVGYEPDLLLQPIARGHLRSDEALRRDALAQAIDRVRLRGARLVEIEAALGLGFSKQRVSDLARRGAELAAVAHQEPTSTREPSATAIRR